MVVQCRDTDNQISTEASLVVICGLESLPESVVVLVSERDCNGLWWHHNVPNFSNVSHRFSPLMLDALVCGAVKDASEGDCDWFLDG